MNVPRDSIFVFGEARGSRGLAGIGLVHVDASGKERQRRGQYLGVTTAAQAEYTAVLEGIRHAVALGRGSVIVTGSDAVCRQLSGKSTALVPEVMELFAEARQLLARNPAIELRAGGGQELEAAERLASIAIDSRGRRTTIE